MNRLDEIAAQGMKAAAHCLFPVVRQNGPLAVRTVCAAPCGVPGSGRCEYHAETDRPRLKAQTAHQREARA